MIRTVVFTSDDYLHCLPGFAYCWNKHLPSRLVSVVCYQEPDFDLPHNFTVYSVGKQSEHTWSSGAMEFLRAIHDPYVIVMLEDYFLQSVDVGLLKVLETYALEHYGQVGRIDLTHDLLDRPSIAHHTEGTLQMERAADNALYQFSLQASIWDRKFMLQYMKAHEDPWQCEKGASKRIIAARPLEPRQVLAVRNGVIFKYVNAVGGQGAKPGQWDIKKFPPTMWQELESRGLVEKTKKRRTRKSKGAEGDGR